MNLLYIKSKKLIINIEHIVSAKSDGEFLSIALDDGKYFSVTNQQEAVDIFDKLANLSTVRV